MSAIDIRSRQSGSKSWPGDAPRTVIQADLTIIGDLQTDGHIEVDGRVIGNVNGSSVTVSENGQVEGSILAETVTIFGIAVGPVQANKVLIGSSAQVVGNIFHNELTVEPGAYHEGRRPWRPNIERKPIFER
jgi:cytoskeletal protein CcmA (bactofilin family)